MIINSDEEEEEGGGGGVSGEDGGGVRDGGGATTSIVVEGLGRRRWMMEVREWIQALVSLTRSVEHQKKRKLSHQKRYHSYL